MKKKFSTAWKASKLPRKQKKFRYSAPLHLRHKFLSVTLSKDLRKKHGIRNIPVRVGDKVKVMKGNYRDTTGKVERVDLHKIRVFVENVNKTKADGTKAFYPLSPSNLMITDLNLSDERRTEIVERQRGAK